MAENQNEHPIVNIVAYLQTSRFYGSSRDKFVELHANDPPVMMTIRGPGANSESTAFVTGSGSALTGKAGPYEVVSQTVYTLPQDVALITIGRAPRQHVRITNKHVSKFHASLRRDINNASVLRIHDESSMHGTALVRYNDTTGFIEDLKSESNIPIVSGGSADLENRIVIELAGKECGTRLAFFTDYGSIWDYLSSVMNR